MPDKILPHDPPWRITHANPPDVDSAFHDLKRDMNPVYVHVFLDKLQRYAAKPDRALFLAATTTQTIAFATIIDHSPPPNDSSPKIRQALRDHACGTGLMVLPEFRKQGIASELVKQWEVWARRQERCGIWVITRQMAPWYQRRFGYSELGETWCQGVKKTILSKTL